MSSDSPSPPVRGRRIDSLRPHEATVPEDVKQLKHRLESEGKLNRPILVDRESGVILDGHHRWRALRELDALWIPAVVIEYLSEKRVDLAPGPNCPTDNLTRGTVLEMGQSGEVFPPKSTRHRVRFDSSEPATALTDLRQEPPDCS